MERIQLKNSLFISFLEVLLNWIHYPNKFTVQTNNHWCCHVGKDVVRVGVNGQDRIGDIFEKSLV